MRSAMDAVASGRPDDRRDGRRRERGRTAAGGLQRDGGGLRERERLRDLFGRQVGADVAREALERGVELGGQARRISVLFVDVIGSTSLAAREPARAGGRGAQPLLHRRGRGGGASRRAGQQVRGRRRAWPSSGRRASSPTTRPSRSPRRVSCARLQALQAEVGLDAAIGVSSGEGGPRRLRDAVRVHRHRRPGERGRASRSSPGASRAACSRAR